jgi:aminopeptidase-like protein
MTNSISIKDSTESFSMPFNVGYFNALNGHLTKKRYKVLLTILEALQDAKIGKYKTHIDIDNSTRNLSFFIENKALDTKVIIAHYDVINEFNANDNTSSLVVSLNLIQYSQNLSNRFNYLFVFTDKEETGLKGATSFCQNYIDYTDSPIIDIINLELLGNGNMILSDNLYGQEKVDFPISDATALRKFFPKVSTLVNVDKNWNREERCEHWRKCHTDRDNSLNVTDEGLKYSYNYIINVLNNN